MSETAQVTNTEQQGTPQFYYTVASHNILLEAGIKTEIIESHEIYPIPHTPGWCQGMISLRGKLIPVANFHSIFQNTAAVKSNWLIVLEQSPFPEIAIRIDQLPQQQIINQEIDINIEGQNLPSWLTASVSIDDKTFYRANHSQLFEQLRLENEQANPNRDSSGNDA